MFGKGSTKRILSEKDILSSCGETFESLSIEGKRLLFIIPDHTRTAPMDLMFRIVYSLLSKRVNQLDFLVALGTHPPMSMDAIYKRVGINKEEHNRLFPKARFFNHEWNNPGQLHHIGTIPEKEINHLSEGLMTRSVDVTVNKMVLDYDLLIILGPTFPHEVVGFSGGNKYLFPGIAGPEIIDMFHWLGAIITSMNIIGVKKTPVRRVVDRAASMISTEKLCMSMVVRGDGLAGLYIGTPESAWQRAADLSEKIHIIYKDRPFETVLACAPKMYDDLWTGGKCMYKLEPVVADGGELIIYAPRIKEVSVTHGKKIEAIGYHVRDYFIKQPGRFAGMYGGVMAHSTHVKGTGSYTDEIESPRIWVTLATGISESLCSKINLGYRDPAGINLSDFKNREDEGVLLVEKAGETLYRLAPK